METDKQKYRQLCSSGAEIPIFSKDWWLDAVCGETNWDVVLVEKNNEIKASLPFYVTKKFGLTNIRMPNSTQTMGPWLKPSDAKYSKKLSQQKDLLNELIKKLPKHGQFQQNFHYSFKNWLPFYWSGFQQTTLYTYVIESLQNTDSIWEGMLPNIRTDIKKAANRFGLQIKTDLGIDAFLTLSNMVYKRQGIENPYPRDFVETFDKACEKNNARKMFFAQDKEGKIHSAVYIVWDSQSAYYLMSGSDPDLRNSGANSLCLWEAIKFCASVTQKFNFEGSMIEPIEKFFRSFGALQKPYFQISRTTSRLVKIINALKTLKKAI